MSAATDELVDAIAEATCQSAHAGLEIVRLPNASDPRMRVAACFSCQDAAEAALAALVERYGEPEIEATEHTYDYGQTFHRERRLAFPWQEVTE